MFYVCAYKHASKMDKISELNEKLDHGDLKWISTQTRIPYNTVQKIFSGKRSANTPKGRRLQKAAQLLIVSREEVAKSIKSVEL